MHNRMILAIAAAVCANLGGGALAQEGTPVNVGLSLGLTGPLASVVQPFLAGVKTCVDEANRNGGPNGHKINLNIIDDGYSPERTVVAVRRLVSQDNVDLVGTFGTSTTVGALEYMARSGTVFFPYGGIAGLTEPFKPSVFTIQPTYVDQARFAVKYVVSTYKPKNVNMFYAQLEGMDQAAEDIKKAITAAGGSVGFTGSYQLGSIKNFDQVVQNLSAGNPDTVFVLTSAADGSQIIKGLRAKGINAPIVGNVTFADPLLTTLAGADSKQVLGVAAQEVPGAPALSEIEQKISAANSGTKITQYNIAGYGWCQIVSGALAKVDRNTKAAKEPLIKAFESLSGFATPTLPPITFTSRDHYGVKALGMTLSDGTTVKRITDYIPIQ